MTKTDVKFTASVKDVIARASVMGNPCSPSLMWLLITNKRFTPSLYLWCSLDTCQTKQISFSCFYWKSSYILQLSGLHFPSKVSINHYRVQASYMKIQKIYLSQKSPNLGEPHPAPVQALPTSENRKRQSHWGAHWYWELQMIGTNCFLLCVLLQLHTLTFLSAPPVAM